MFDVLPIITLSLMENVRKVNAGSLLLNTAQFKYKMGLVTHLCWFRGAAVYKLLYKNLHG